MKEKCICTLVAAGLGLALATDVMADGARRSGDPLSNKSPAMQERANKQSLRKVANAPQPAGIAGPPVNDNCAAAVAIFDGDTAYSTIGATTDGPSHAAACNFFGDPQISQDIWFDYTATGDGNLNVSLCGSLYDTEVAVYDGCACPVSDANLLACNDDSCGLQSAVFGVPALTGNCYKIRVGGFGTASGTGNINIQVTTGGVWPQCGVAGHDCCTPGGPGCDDVACCELVCNLDNFCCTTSWDTICVGEADDLCGKIPGEYCPSPCSPDNPQTCDVGGGLPGCNDVECCETVCCVDAFCCDVAWDGLCVSQAATLCGEPCSAACPPGGVLEVEQCGEDLNGGCNSLSACDGPFPDCCFASGGLGCSDPACTASICAADPFCCDVAWDGICAAAACNDPNCQCDPLGGTPFQDINCGDTVCGTHWADGNFRDTDWYHFSVADCGTVATWSVNSEFPAAVFILPGDCPPVLLAIGSGTCPNVATAELFAGTYTAFVAPAAFNCLPCGGELNDYTATLTCDGPCPGDIAGGPGGSPDGQVNTDDLLKVINNWGPCK